MVLVNDLQAIAELSQSDRQPKVEQVALAAVVHPTAPHHGGGERHIVAGRDVKFEHVECVRRPVHRPAPLRPTAR